MCVSLLVSRVFALFPCQVCCDVTIRTQIVLLSLSRESDSTNTKVHLVGNICSKTENNYLLKKFWKWASCHNCNCLNHRACISSASKAEGYRLKWRSKSAYEPAPHLEFRCATSKLPMRVSTHDGECKRMPKSAST